MDNLQYFKPSIGDEEINEVVDTLKNGWVTMGPKTIAFEKQIAEYIGVKHAITVNSCTAGLHLSLLAHGIGEGDEVITTTNTFAATANTIVHTGAKPVLVDINEETFDMNLEEVEKAITPKTKAITVVHYGGHAVDLEKIKEIAEKHNLKIIEDAAHAVGTELKGKKIGSHGNLTNLSFYATKNMTTGEGGAVLTNDDELANKIRVLRLHGISKDAWKRYGKGGSWHYQIEECGWKYNMTDIQASIGMHQLKKLDSFIQRRREIAKKYNEELREVEGIKVMESAEIEGSSCHLYTLRVTQKDRNEFIKKLEEKGIGISVHFIPLHMHPHYQKVEGYKEGDFPVSEKVYKQSISLPLYPAMTDDDVQRVIQAVKEIANG